MAGNCRMCLVEVEKAAKVSFSGFFASYTCTFLIVILYILKFVLLTAT